MLAEVGLLPADRLFPDFLGLDPDLFGPSLDLVAALALISAMGVAALQFPRYIRSKRLDEQLRVAHRVQQQFPAREAPGELDFFAVCLPAHDVGGDFYDVFQVRDGQFAISFGDVSGKGLPAALVMGLLHGAVRTAGHFWDGTNLGALTMQLNDLLRSRTSEERYVSFFWASYDQDSSVLS